MTSSPTIPTPSPCFTHTHTHTQAFITTKALNEFDPAISGVNWRQKLESQRAAVLATELKNNRNKLARWTCQAMLAGADYLKMGYVSRAHAKDNQHHFVLGTILYRPDDFAKQIDLKVCVCLCLCVCVLCLCLCPCLSMSKTVCVSHRFSLKVENLWGITTAVMKRLMALPVTEGEACKFLLLRDPNVAQVNIYKVPSDSFDYEEQEEDTGVVQDDEDDSDLD